MGIKTNAEWQAQIAAVLLTEEQIQKRVRELAAEIAADYADKHPLLIGVLKGSIVFLADLMRLLRFPLEIDLICVASYGANAISNGAVQLRLDLSRDIQGRHVLLIEDIVDTGHTLAQIVALLQRRQPASLKVCCFLDKPSRRETPVQLDYVGFAIPNEFVVGYGLDYAERFRWLPYVAALKPEVYGGR